MGDNWSGASPRWSSPSSHSHDVQGEEELHPGKLLRFFDGSAWQLCDNEVTAKEHRILQEGRPSTNNYWSLAGDILEKTGINGGSQTTSGGRVSARCQRCGTRVPFDELQEGYILSMVGAKRTRDAEQDTLVYHCRSCRLNTTGNLFDQLVEQEHQEGATIQTATAGDTSPQGSSEDWFSTTIGEVPPYNVCSSSGGLFGRMGGEDLRPPGDGRVGVQSAQSTIYESALGWTDDEYKSQGSAATQEGESTDSHIDQPIPAGCLWTDEGLDDFERDLFDTSELDSTQSTLAPGDNIWEQYWFGPWGGQAAPWGHDGDDIGVDDLYRDSDSRRVG